MSEEPQIRVKDRRRFSSEGEPIEPAEPAEQTAQPESAPTEQPPRRPAPPPASLELLVYSLVMQAEMSLLGGGDEEPPDLDLARHAIDMLGVLHDKTKGNLSLEEKRLLENSLTELRFRFVQRRDELAGSGGAA